MIQLETARLRLRSFDMKDLDELFAYRNDERCARFQRWSTKDTQREALAEVIRKCAACSLQKVGKQQYAIALKENDALVGDVTVFLENPTITLGYTVSPKYQRRGYAFELLSALAEKLHELYSERELICLVEPENIASCNLLKKLGFEDLGYAEKISSQIYGRWALPEET